MYSTKKGVPHKSAGRLFWLQDIRPVPGEIKPFPTHILNIERSIARRPPSRAKRAETAGILLTIILNYSKIGNVYRVCRDKLRPHHGGKSDGMDGTMMKLNECEIGRCYLVRDVLVDEAITRRLEALGVNEGTPVLVLNKKGSGSVIVKVRGTRLAMGRKLSEGICVEEVAAS